MNIQSKFHGDIEVLTEEIISFPKGLLGFETEKQFVILNLDSKDESVFKILQSINTPDVAFIVTNPFHFKPNYQFDIQPELVEELCVGKQNELTTLSIVTILKNGTMTINLLGPVILHIEKRLGYQIVLEGQTYTTKYPIKVEGEETC